MSINPPSLSNYLYERSPLLYGKDKQSDYLRQSEIAINKCVAMMQRADKAERVFESVLEAARGARAMIAREHKTERSEQFGKKRETISFAETPLMDQYREFGSLVKSQLAEKLAEIKREKGTLEPGVYLFDGGALNGKRSQINIRIIDPSYIKGLRAQVTMERIQKALRKEVSFGEVLHTPKLMQKIKQNDPELFHALKLQGNLVEWQCKMYGGHPTPDFRAELTSKPYVEATIEVEAEGKMVPIGNYLTSLEPHVDDIRKSLDPSRISVVHQEAFLIDSTLQEIGKVFRSAMSWKREDGIKTLQESAARFRYLYAFCMPHSRGDGAIGDWLELALYRYHGFDQAKFSQETLPCFEPLASLGFGPYAERHQRTIQLEPPASLF